MYEAFYGFNEKPFSLLPDPTFLYMGEQHSMAYAMLEYGLTNQAGFTVITGGIGCGKTTLVRHLLEELDDDITVGLISNTQQQVGHLLQWVLMAYDLEYRGKSKVELYQVFYDFLIDEYANNRRTVLIIDEAQNLSPKVLEDFRMLSNINADKDQVIQMILVGQPELRELLLRPELEQFAQRIASDYHLSALSEQETEDYIAYRTRQAGVERPVFSKAATALVYRYTRGVPRLINTVCDTALVYGFAEEAEVISDTLIKTVANDKAQTGLLRLDYDALQDSEQSIASESSPTPVEVPPAVSSAPRASTEPRQKHTLVDFDADQARQLFGSLSKKD
jgi:type II secretory pathway predicted ATPase ExeA